jgi:cellulose biosynthesis protein BcsQ
MNRFLMDNVPTWSNKEVLYAFGSAAGVLIPACFTLYRILSTGLRHRLLASHQHTNTIKRELESIKAGSTETPASELLALLDDTQKQVETLRSEKSAALCDSALQKEHADAHRVAAEKLGADVDTIRSRFLAEQKRISRALGADGFTWTEKVRHNAPEFRPLDERRMPIISVLNLKGGVGKTTLTANLGAALSRRGWKVLLIDIDLQGSLTSLYVPVEEQTVLENERRFIGDFLARSFEAEFPSLLSYTRPILAPSASALVGTVDTLAYAEMSLTVRWLLREGNRDPRFLLRRELHLKRISNEFDIVLIDCPPLINVSCVNALAASDTVLIPVMPSKPAIDRVPILLSRMLQFRENINEHLKVLGIVANRTSKAELTVEERNRMSELEVKAKNSWGESVTRFESNIRQSAEVRMAEDEHRPLAEDDQIAAAFERLACEVEGRLPTFCRGTGESTLLHSEVIP